jgi:regulator of replication initiation timing
MRLSCSRAFCERVLTVRLGGKKDSSRKLCQMKQRLMTLEQEVADLKRQAGSRTPESNWLEKLSAQSLMNQLFLKL